MATEALTNAQVLEAVFTAAAAGGAVLGAIGAIIAFFLKRYWDVRDKKLAIQHAESLARDAQRAKERDVLYQSLTWFEGGTQNRSIGIAVVNSSWNKYREFQALWVEVFANQAIYLLAAAKRDDKAHEQDNLRRLAELLEREAKMLAPETRLVLSDTVNRKLSNKIAEGIVITDSLERRLRALSTVLTPNSNGLSAGAQL
jgi:hypothetical protein